jgi:hypothetical protein
MRNGSGLRIRTRIALMFARMGGVAFAHSLRSTGTAAEPTAATTSIALARASSSTDIDRRGRIAARESFDLIALRASRR